jgi:uncharacterized protein (TIGR02466 family)
MTDKKTAQAAAGEEAAAAQDTEPVIRESYFPTNIYYRDLHDVADLNRRLVDYLYGLREADPEGITRSNVKATGSWHSTDDLHRHEIFAPLMARIADTIREVWVSMRVERGTMAVCDNIWAIINPPGGFNRFHTHPNSLWSGVYYLQAPPDSGRLYFTDPRPQAGVLTPRYAEEALANRDQWSEVYFQPTEGRIILFPAWLAHGVEPNTTTLTGPEADRICVAFNYNQQLPATR